MKKVTGLPYPHNRPNPPMPSQATRPPLKYRPILLGMYPGCALLVLRLGDKQIQVTEIPEQVLHAVRLYVFRQSAETTRVPQASEISQSLGREIGEIRTALKQLALNKVLILAPNHSSIWAANPFCAVPSGFRVQAGGKNYWAICIWDALGVAAALHKDAVIDAACGDCGNAMQLEIADGNIARGEGIVHFAVPAHQWWDNIAFT